MIVSVKYMDVTGTRISFYSILFQNLAYAAKKNNHSSVWSRPQIYGIRFAMHTFLRFHVQSIFNDDVDWCIFRPLYTEENNSFEQTLNSTFMKECTI